MTQEVYLPSPEATSPSEALPVCLPCPHSLSGPGAPEAIQGSRGPSPLDMPHAPQDRATEEREKGMGWCLPPRVAPHCAQREVLWAHAPPQSALCMELGSREESEAPAWPCHSAHYPSWRPGALPLRPDPRLGAGGRGQGFSLAFGLCVEPPRPPGQARGGDGGRTPPEARLRRQGQGLVREVQSPRWPLEPGRRALRGGAGALDLTSSP